MIKIKYAVTVRSNYLVMYSYTSSLRLLNRARSVGDINIREPRIAMVACGCWIRQLGNRI